MQIYQIVSDIPGTQVPRIHIGKNEEGKLIFNLRDWNTLESEDGWSSDELEELISTLKLALEKSKEINILENTDFLFDQH